MITFRKRTFVEKLLRLIPSYRRRMDRQLYEAIKFLVENPDAPCMIDSTIVPNGWGGKIT
jgi:hypothetical protein